LNDQDYASSKTLIFFDSARKTESHPLPDADRSIWKGRVRRSLVPV